MSTSKRSKLNQLLANTPKGIVLLSTWLKSNGYSPELIKRYRNSGWLESIGVGANIRFGDRIDCLGALHALQIQLGSSLHVGARTALSFLGKSHYLELSRQKIILLGAYGDRKLPTWFRNHDWGTKIEFYTSDFLPVDLGLVEFEYRDFSVNISGEIRALMECLLLTPEHQEVMECYELLESMNNLHPKKVQELLENCNSIKVKRLFLCFAEKIKHEWFNYLDISKINLGAGKRHVVDGGVLDRKYLITIPRALLEK